MPYYNLKINSDGRILSTVAASVDHALQLFGAELGVRLTVELQDGEPCYLLDEWDEGPHWINPHIPVFEISN